ncbi:probable sugar phosphate/phosphate translocator At3g17430 isoform X2 [Carya illinoinensis]|uniref:probable sugar phosphate/phosphate translocator At3g17430 isoform X2 n=1 Tax=Carya illinoinensis TaxID=32201 RepID=UPI001C71A059|nr:probable sugar phosphate/phosphate translocator At3g17430 isoform X2 [Carya illinoinensis]
MINITLASTYLYLLIYILLSSGVILYNKWVLSPKYFNFPFPITLTMIHMGFSGAVAFFLVRVFKVVSPVKMTFEIYATCVVPISAFFASSLWFGNTAFLHISVAFIQMLKALIYQVTGIFAEALRLVLTQVLLQKKGLTLNPITSLYYIAPCRYFCFEASVFWRMNNSVKSFVAIRVLFFFINLYTMIFKHLHRWVHSKYYGMTFSLVDTFTCSFVFLFVPWCLLEMTQMQVFQDQNEFNFWIFFSNALCALALNFSIFLVIGRTGAVTIRVAGVVKDWMLIALSTVIFPESTITGLNIIGYGVALCGIFMYNYLKVNEVRVSQQSPERMPERITKDFDEETPLLSTSRLSRIGRSLQLMHDS